MTCFVPQGAVEDIKLPDVHIIDVRHTYTPEDGPQAKVRFKRSQGAEQQVLIQLPRPSTYTAYQHGYFELGPLTFFFDLQFHDAGPSLTFRFDRKDDGTTWQRWSLRPVEGSGDDSDCWNVIES